MGCVKCHAVALQWCLPGGNCHSSSGLWPSRGWVRLLSENYSKKIGVMEPEAAQLMTGTYLQYKAFIFRTVISVTSDWIFLQVVLYKYDHMTFSIAKTILKWFKQAWWCFFAMTGWNEILTYCTNIVCKCAGNGIGCSLTEHVNNHSHVYDFVFAFNCKKYSLNSSGNIFL